MEDLSEEQIEEFKEAFSLFDTEGKGSIEFKELGTVLRSLGIHTSDEEKLNFIKDYDNNEQGIIYFNDFLQILKTKIAETKTEDELREAFNLFDLDKNKQLNVEAFKQEMNLYCPGMDHKDLEDICNFLKQGNSGRIDLDDVVPILYDKIKNHLN